MTAVNVRTIFPATSGIPEDTVTNSWHFDVRVDILSPDFIPKMVEINVALRDYYTSFSPFGSSLLSPDKCRIEGYVLSDPEPRQPRYDAPFGNFTWGVNAAPTEVSLCMSYQAARQSGVPQARRRGRVYMPPMALNALGADGRPDVNVIDIINTAADTLLDASEAAADWDWIQYSPTDLQMSDIDNGWVDDEFDTQRRRGRKATTRVTFPLP